MSSARTEMICGWIFTTLQLVGWVIAMQSLYAEVFHSLGINFLYWVYSAASAVKGRKSPECVDTKHRFCLGFTQPFSAFENHLGKIAISDRRVFWHHSPGRKDVTHCKRNLVFVKYEENNKHTMLNKQCFNIGASIVIKHIRYPAKTVAFCFLFWSASFIED